MRTALKPRQEKKFYYSLNKFPRIRHVSQLREGMTLIDNHLFKRNVLHLTETHIWLSHKYGRKSKLTGKIWPIETFMRLPNWIFKD